MSVCSAHTLFDLPLRDHGRAFLGDDFRYFGLSGHSCPGEAPCLVAAPLTVVAAADLEGGTELLRSVMSELVCGSAPEPTTVAA